MNAANPDVLRRYLLGTADPTSRDEIEQRLFSDDQVLWERLSLAEDELIDDYAARHLDENERRLFESRFLCTAERRAKMEFAFALRAYAREGRAARLGLWAWLRMPAAVPRWTLAAAAGVVLLLVPGLVWQVGPARRAPSAVTISLAPGLLRGADAEITRVVPAPGCQVLYVNLAVGGAPYAAYAATLYDVNGEAIWSQHKLDGTAREGSVSVRLTLPCELLPEGDYWVRLSGRAAGGEAVALDRYDFRVLRD
jgi:hypothetical protein